MSVNEINPTETPLAYQDTTLDEFEKQIISFFQKNKVTLYILTPCFASLCYVNYVNSLLSTIKLFKQLNIQLNIEFCKNDSLVPRARNNLIARGMTNKEATHFLFIDNDITWNPIDIIKLIMSDKDLIGGIYPLKKYEWGQLVKDQSYIPALLKRKNVSHFAKVISDSEMVQQNLLKYNINHLNQTIEVTNNLTTVKHVATGFMMLKRNMVTTMMNAFPSSKYVDDVNFLTPEENDMAYALFNCEVVDGHYYSEDWVFCDKWSKLGGDIYVDVSINLTHTGIEDYQGSYLSTLI
jgi:hypothetical protein